MLSKLGSIWTRGASTNGTARPRARSFTGLVKRLHIQSVSEALASYRTAQAKLDRAIDTLEDRSHLLATERAIRR